MDSRRGLQMWGPVGRWVFLNWPRGSWQYDLICGAIIVGLFVLPNPPLTPQMDVDEVLGAIEAADTELDSFTADMSSTERNVVFDDEETESGTVAFLKPAYFRRHVTEPNDRTEIIAEDTVTVYIPRIKQAQIISIAGSLDEGQELVVPGLASSSELRSAYDVTMGETAWDEDGGMLLYTIRLVPKPETTPAKHYRSITLQVAAGEWHPARLIVLEDHGGNTTSITLTHVVRNPGLGPDDFKLDLPADTDIVSRGGVSDIS